MSAIIVPCIASSLISGSICYSMKLAINRCQDGYNKSQITVMATIIASPCIVYLVHSLFDYNNKVGSAAILGAIIGWLIKA